MRETDTVRADVKDLGDELVMSAATITIFEVSVPATALSELILAVHNAAAPPTRSARRKWKYGNIIGISGAKVSELDRTTAQNRHYRLRRPVAAVEVTQRRLSADVLFDVDATRAVATAYFSGAGEASPRHDPHEEAAWASFLAASTADTLIRDGVKAVLSPRLAT